MSPVKFIQLKGKEEGIFLETPHLLCMHGSTRSKRTKDRDKCCQWDPVVHFVEVLLQSNDLLRNAETHWAEGRRRGEKPLQMR